MLPTFLQPGSKLCRAWFVTDSDDGEILQNSRYNHAAGGIANGIGPGRLRLQSKPVLWCFVRHSQRCLLRLRLSLRQSLLLRLRLFTWLRLSGTVGLLPAGVHWQQSTRNHAAGTATASPGKTAASATTPASSVDQTRAAQAQAHPLRHPNPSTTVTPARGFPARVIAFRTSRTGTRTGNRRHTHPGHPQAGFA